jgi:Spy/CpxP family protein refolding chaperone
MKGGDGKMRSLMVLLMVGLLLTPAFAAWEMVHPMMMRGSMMVGGSMMYPLCPMMGHSALDTYVSYRDELKLTDKQVKELKSIRSAYKKEIAKRNAEITALQSDLDELYDADKVDYKAIGKKVAEIEGVQSKLRAAYFDALDKADKVLTEEQRKKIQTLTGGMMHRMEEKPSESEHHHRGM